MRADGFNRMWRPGAAYSPTVTPHDTEPDIIVVKKAGDIRRARVAASAALEAGRPVNVITRQNDAGTLVCRILPCADYLMVIGPDVRSTGTSPDAAAALSRGMSGLAERLESFDG